MQTVKTQYMKLLTSFSARSYGRQLNFGNNFSFLVTLGGRNLSWIMDLLQYVNICTVWLIKSATCMF